jgi:hypothetical protein
MIAPPSSTDEDAKTLYDIDQDFVHYEDGGLHFVNEQFMANQRYIIWEFMKEIGKNLFSGSIFKISMPVGLCEGRSFLQRIPDQWAFLPKYVSKAAALTAADFNGDKTALALERMKNVIAMSISGLHFTCRMDKPFNPILGETFQGVFSDGTQVLLEQVSHHPPISSWNVIGPNNSFKFTGNGLPVAKFRTNSMIVGINARNVIEFADGTSIKFQFPKFSINGLIMGSRIVEYFGNWVFYDEANGLVCVLEFTDNTENMGGWFTAKNIVHKSDYFTGIIQKGTVVFGEHSDDSTGHVSIDLKGKPLCRVEGSWIENVKFDGVSYWDRKEHASESERPTAPSFVLPSDSRFRSDAEAVRALDWSKAETEKLRLEEIQRRDRKLREAFHGPQEH